MRAHLAELIPDAGGPLRAAATCMYTNTPDFHFIIDRHPAHANVALACGFSGHGFKFASVVGEVLADLALRGETSLPIGLFALGRFRPPAA
jgi:sarcosine oxidase